MKTIKACGRCLFLAWAVLAGANLDALTVTSVILAASSVNITNSVLATSSHQYGRAVLPQ